MDRSQLRSKRKKKTVGKMGTKEKDEPRSEEEENRGKKQKKNAKIKKLQVNEEERKKSGITTTEAGRIITLPLPLVFSAQEGTGDRECGGEIKNQKIKDHRKRIGNLKVNNLKIKDVKIENQEVKNQEITNRGYTHIGEKNANPKGNATLSQRSRPCCPGGIQKKLTEIGFKKEVERRKVLKQTVTQTLRRSKTGFTITSKQEQVASESIRDRKQMRWLERHDRECRQGCMSEREHFPARLTDNGIKKRDLETLKREKEQSIEAALQYIHGNSVHVPEKSSYLNLLHFLSRSWNSLFMVSESTRPVCWIESIQNTTFFCNLFRSLRQEPIEFDKSQFFAWMGPFHDYVANLLEPTNLNSTAFVKKKVWESALKEKGEGGWTHVWPKNFRLVEIVDFFYHPGLNFRVFVVCLVTSSNANYSLQLLFPVNFFQGDWTEICATAESNKLGRLYQKMAMLQKCESLVRCQIKKKGPQALDLVRKYLDEFKFPSWEKFDKKIRNMEWPYKVKEPETEMKNPSKIYFLGHCKDSQCGTSAAGDFAQHALTLTS